VIPIAEPRLADAERERIQAVLDGGQLADGPEVRAFEREFADYCGTDHAVATANGTTALHAALEALGVAEGDTVATATFSFVATANAIRLAGADPLLLDVDPETYALDVDALERALRDGADVDAVVAVHLYGLPAAMDRLTDLGERYDFDVVEDAAQAHGGGVDGTRTGALGDVGCFSFYPTKNATTGEGGMVTTDRDDVAERAARFVNHGRGEGAYDHVTVGHNFRLTSIGAAIGRVQLDRLPGFLEARRENAARLTARLSDLPVVTPVEPGGRTHAYNQYTIQTPERDAVRDALEERGVGTGVYYPKPIHDQPAYDRVDADAATAERLADRVLSLPVHPGVTAADCERIADAVEASLAQVGVGE